MNYSIPADVPRHKRDLFEENYTAITHGANKLVLFAADQKMEHVANAPMHPETFFKIAMQGRIGALATQFGLIARYGRQYYGIDYIVKLNSKTDIGSVEAPDPVHDPLSAQLWTVHDIIELKQYSDLALRGVGYTIYLGSSHEALMLSQAAQIVRQAHEQGLVVILWAYPRGKYVINPRKASLITSAASIAACLGADFVKVTVPEATATHSSALLLQAVVKAAGNTQVICSGGPAVEPVQFLTTLYDQFHTGGIAGGAIGRNIFSHDLDQSVAMTRAISAIMYDGADLEAAIKYVQG